MKISYNGYNNNVITMKNFDAKIGHLVSVNQDGEAVTCALGKPFIGVCVSLRDGIVGIQTDGYIELPYESLPEYGMCCFVSGSSTSVNTAEFATALKAYKVLKIDTVHKTVGFLL